MHRIRLVPVAFMCLGAVSLACSDETTAPANVEESNLSWLKWFYSSTPVSYRNQGSIPLDDPDRGELLWFSPSNVQVADIDPGETSQTRRNDRVSALEIIYVPSDSADTPQAWGGLASPVAQDQSNISGKQYLEVWLNDYIPIERSPERRGELYIDVGQVSEDAVWDPQTPPLPADQVLDFEDKNHNAGQAEVNEDRGLDYWFNEDEPPRRPGIRTFSPFTATQDPAGDDANLNLDENAPENTITQRIAKFRGLNGTEANNRLDNEDLNGNYQLDQENSYIEYKIALADSALIDNRRDFSIPLQDPQSGWRMYRIALNEFDQTIGSFPNLSRIQAVRMWFRGFAPGDTLDLQVGGFAFVTEDTLFAH
jgi:cell surface protein SprA